MRSLTEYVVGLIGQGAQAVIGEHQAMRRADDVFDRFIAPCEQADAPNEKLREALLFAES